MTQFLFSDPSVRHDVSTALLLRVGRNGPKTGPEDTGNLTKLQIKVARKIQKASAILLRDAVIAHFRAVLAPPPPLCYSSPL